MSDNTTPEPGVVRDEPPLENAGTSQARGTLRCNRCGYLGDIRTYLPAESAYSDVRCPKCRSTNNEHNAEYLRRMMASRRPQESTPTEPPAERTPVAASEPTAPATATPDKTLAAAWDQAGKVQREAAERRAAEVPFPDAENKTPGQVAYEAYWMQFVGKDNLRDWPRCIDRAAWEAAAAAVTEQLRQELTAEQSRADRKHNLLCVALRERNEAQDAAEQLRSDLASTRKLLSLCCDAPSKLEICQQELVAATQVVDDAGVPSGDSLPSRIFKIVQLSNQLYDQLSKMSELLTDTNKQLHTATQAKVEVERERDEMRQYRERIEHALGRGSYATQKILEHFNGDGTLKGDGKWRAREIWNSCKAFDECLNVLSHLECGKATTEAQQLREAVTAAQQRAEQAGAGWIPVGDRMPPVGREVLVYTFGDDEHVTAKLTESSGWRVSTGHVSRNWFTHWRPIPPPPHTEPATSDKS